MKQVSTSARRHCLSIEAHSRSLESIHDFDLVARVCVTAEWAVTVRASGRSHDPVRGT